MRARLADRIKPQVQRWAAADVFQPPSPITGSQRNCTEKSRISRMPRKKAGMDNPNRLTVMAVTSKDRIFVISRDNPRGNAQDRPQ